ncbi:carbohydrate-binding protein [Compostibacter hankyongensis]|uniref:Carbohydrate-binding protein n=1 Tax=Compostibacter hankyongensis TaxID=1007089 RepID=A0ABP8G8M3_9BACT
MLRSHLSTCLLLSCLASAVFYSSCYKDKGYYNYKNTLREFEGSSYDFLKSQQGIYDSFLLALDRVNLADSLKKGDYTVFAPTNASFQQAFEDLNTLRKTQDRPLQYIANVPLNDLDSLVCRYIIRGKFSGDSMAQQDGRDIPAIRYGYMMHGKLNYSNAEGYVEGGPSFITFSDTKGVVYTRQWSNVNTVALDIKTTNGFVNVLERDHLFGFDALISHVNPTFSKPHTGVPIWVPGIIGLDQYDLGGERVAYHDNDASNNGGKYRTGEGVDIENSGEGGFDVGWTAAYEWMNYSVNVADTGTYKVLVRAASPDNNGALHLEIDDKPGHFTNITGSMRVPGTGGYQNYTDVEATVRLDQPGLHTIRMIYEYANYNLRFIKIMPVGRPYPVPGFVPVEDFDPGGEGVAYHDNDASNNGGRWRPGEGVDIEFSGEGGGYDVGWTNAGEWIEYTIDVKKTGVYNLDVRVGSPNDPGDGSRFHVEFDGKDETGPLVCPKTGGWTNWTDIRTSVYLSEGIHKMRFFEETGGYNIKGFLFNPIH